MTLSQELCQFYFSIKTVVYAGAQENAALQRTEKKPMHHYGAPIWCAPSWCRLDRAPRGAVSASPAKSRDNNGVFAFDPRTP
jgi:hypothetical protein